MLSYRPISIAAATFIRFYHVYSATRWGDMTIRVHESRDSPSACQECVLDISGATRMYIFSSEIDENTNTKLLTYKISGSDFTFSNLLPDCNISSLCDIENVKMPSSQNHQPFPQSKYPLALDVKKFKSICLLTQPWIDVLCIHCLQEGATAMSIGKFRLAASPGYAHTLLVLYEPKNEPMLDACVKFCEHTAFDYVENSICMKLLKKLSFEETVLPSFPESDEKIPSKRYHANERSSNALKRLREPSSESDHPFKASLQAIERAASHTPSCLRLEMSTHTMATSACHFCLIKSFDTAAIAVNKGQMQIVYLFHQLSTRESQRTFHICKTACGSIKVMVMKDSNCHLRVVDHFLTYPIEYQLMAKLPLFIKAPMRTGCVWAQYTLQDKQCFSCLQMMEESTLHQLSDSTALFSLHPLAPNKRDVRKGYLGRCINGCQSVKLSFVPNVICGYEVYLEIAEKTQHAPQANSYSAKNADYNRNIFTQSASMLQVNMHDLLPVLVEICNALLPDHRNPDTAAPSSSLHEPNVPNHRMNTLTKAHEISRSGVRHWLNLGPSSSVTVKPLVQTKMDRASSDSAWLTLGFGSATSSKDVQLSIGPSETNIRKVLSQSQENATSRASLGHNYLRTRAEANHDPHQATHITVIYSTNINRNHFMACILCLASAREVFLVSVRRSYAWIAERTLPAESFGCKQCEDMKETNALKLSIYPLRPISARRIIEMFSNYEGMSSKT